MTRLFEAIWVEIPTVPLQPHKAPQLLRGGAACSRRSAGIVEPKSQTSTSPEVLSLKRRADRDYNGWS